MTFPIVLLHDVCRFDVLWKGILRSDNNDDPRIDNYHYFRGVRTMLQRHGFQVWHSCVPWAASVEIRAKALNRNIRTILESPSKPDKVHLIAHSMGGLDARHMMFDDRDKGRIHERIASLTTISTPHSGSPFADWGTRHLPRVFAVAWALGLDLKAIEDLKTDRCQKFNQTPEVKDFEQKIENTILLQTYAGQQDRQGIFWPMKISHRIIRDEEGDNDGLVSVRSARWQDRYFRKILPGTDHLNELGWWNFGQISEKESPSHMRDRIHNFYLEVCNNLRHL